MADPQLRLLLRCTHCGLVEDRNIPLAQLRRYPDATFAPVVCHACKQLAAVPTIRPYRLSENDRRFLRSIRITPDDDNAAAA